MKVRPDSTESPFGGPATGKMVDPWAFWVAMAVLIAFTGLSVAILAMGV